MIGPATRATPQRLWTAAALAVLPLGLAWSRGFVGSDVPVRVFLVLAAAAFVFAAMQRRTPQTRRVARLGTAALGIGAALAAGAGARATLLCCLVALVLTVPLVWRRPVLAHSPPPG